MVRVKLEVHMVRSMISNQQYGSTRLFKSNEMARGE